MLCPRCYGKHVVVTNGSRIPCPECAGVGELHCCDGLREQDDCPVVDHVATRPAHAGGSTRELSQQDATPQAEPTLVRAPHGGLWGRVVVSGRLQIE